MLEVEHVDMTFSGIRALRDVSMTASENSVTALIGPNGAGKTTLFNCVSRILKPVSGTIRVGGEDIRAFRPTDLIRKGIARTFQHAALFDSLDVAANVQIGADGAKSAGRRPAAVLDLLDLLDLSDVADRAVGGLPYGTRKRIELARALASAPSLLLLDEPAGGLTHEEVADMRDRLLELRRSLGLTILLVEHHVNMVMSMSDNIVVLASGSVIAAGTPREVQMDPQVIEAYLGAGATA